MFTRLKNRIKDKVLNRFGPANEFGLDNQSNRDAWIKSQLQALSEGSRLLDAGAGECPYKNACGHLTYVSQDFGQYDGQGDQIGLQMGSWDNSKLDIVCDICHIPESDHSFDAILCSEVFEHLPYPLKALKEFSRLLKPGGILILTAPFSSMTHFAPYHFQTGFNKYYYETHLPENGFDILECVPNGSYFDYVAQEIHRLPWSEDQYAKGAPKLTDSESFVYTLARRVLLHRLKQFSQHDSGSSEMMCFGFHVKARKR